MAFIAPAIGMLIAANTPALDRFVLLSCNLGDAGMRPLLEALPRNTHLSTLAYVESGMSDAFMRDVLLPAVRANTSLVLLISGDEHEAAVEARALIAART